MEKEMCSLGCRYLETKKGAPTVKDGFPEELKDPIPNTIETIYFCKIKSVVMGRSLAKARLLKNDSYWPTYKLTAVPESPKFGPEYVPWGTNPIELDDPRNRDCLAPDQKEMVGH